MKFIERIKSAYEIADERIIIQADGTPISGGRDDLNTTCKLLQLLVVLMKN